MRINSIYVMYHDGRCLFMESFTPKAPSKNLVTGMLTALQSFVYEVTGSYPTSLTSGGFVFHFLKRGPITLVLTASHRPDIPEELDDLSLRFLNKFGGEIDNWIGQMDYFSSFKEDIHEILGVEETEKRVDPTNPLNSLQLLDIDNELQPVAKGIITEGEATSEEMTKYTEESEYRTRLKLEQLVELGYIGRLQKEDEFVYFIS